MSEREWETDPRPSGLVGPATRSHVQSVLFLFVNMIKEYWRGEESRHSLLFFYLFHLNVIKLFSKEEKIKRLQSFHCVTRVSIFCFSVRKYKKTPNNKFTETNDKLASDQSLALKWNHQFTEDDSSCTDLDSKIWELLLVCCRNEFYI